MPKRQAIVPQMARAPKRGKKKAIAEASNNEDEPPEPEAQEDQRPTGKASKAGKMLSLVHEQAPEATGHAIASLPDAADKPERFFSWLIAPMTPQDFFDDMHERRPFHVQRPHQAEYYNGWLGRKQIDALLRAGKLKYTEHVDVTSYTDGERQTHNGEGVAPAAEVWSRFKAGCSIRLSWPQRHSDGVWGMVALLEEYFGCGGGCNAYLTPAHSQGFAPHFDDVDALILQAYIISHTCNMHICACACACACACMGMYVTVPPYASYALILQAEAYAAIIWHILHMYDMCARGSFHLLRAPPPPPPPLVGGGLQALEGLRAALQRGGAASLLEPQLQPGGDRRACGGADPARRGDAVPATRLYPPGG